MNQSQGFTFFSILLRISVAENECAGYYLGWKRFQSTKHLAAEESLKNDFGEAGNERPANLVADGAEPPAGIDSQAEVETVAAALPEKAQGSFNRAEEHRPGTDCLWREDPEAAVNGRDRQVLLHWPVP